MQVVVTAPIHPTEDPDRVAAAVTCTFAGTPEPVEGAVRLRSDAPDALDTLRRRVWELRIIDTFRSHMLRSMAADGRSVSFTLQKQAAAVGRVAIPVRGHPLGDVRVTVTLGADDRWPDAEALCWWLCPETKDGEIVGPT